MRFLRTKPEGVGSAYEILGIEHELERRGFEPYDQISHSFVNLAARVAGRLRVNVLLNPFPGDPMLVVGGYVPDATCFPTSPRTRASSLISMIAGNRLSRNGSRSSSAIAQSRFPDRPLRGRALPTTISEPPISMATRVCRSFETLSDIPLVDRAIDVLELGRKYDAFSVIAWCPSSRILA